MIEERAGDIAAAAAVLLRNPAWRHRRVETLTVLSHEHVRRHVSVDFTVPEEHHEELRLSADEFVVPLAWLAKRPLAHFDLRNEEGHSIPLLTADQNAAIDRELLYALLDEDLGAQDAGAAATDILPAAAPLVEAVVGTGAGPGDVERFDASTGSSRSASCGGWSRGSRGRSSSGRSSAGWNAGASSSSRSTSRTRRSRARLRLRGAGLHRGVELPRRGGGAGRPQGAHDAPVGRGVRRGPGHGAPDADRPALYLSADPARPPGEPELVVDFGAERGRFLAPAAIVSTVIALLVALPWLLADLEALATSSGPAIGLVLSTSAVFSVLVLRTDEHPLLRRLLVRYRLALVGEQLAALFAAAALGFQADAWVIEATWAVASVAAAVTTGILWMAVARSPSL